jgi:hypothetical protein
VALSDDEGMTWKMKKLPENILTVGYTTACQGPDGTVHVVTSKNQPNYEIELNEAWILAAADAPSVSAATAVTMVKHLTERDPSGTRRVVWSSGRANDGRVLLEGPEVFYFSNGRVQWSVNFHLGKKVGDEIFCREDGSKVWQKTYGANGTWTWRQFDATGTQIAESRWKGKTLLGESQ